MGLVKTIAETANPVSLDEAKAHLRIEHDYDNDWINDTLGEVVEFIQSLTNHQLMPATYRYTLDSFPSGRLITLPMAHAQSVTSVQYVDTNGDTQTFNSSGYTVDVDSMPARIVINDGTQTPETNSQPAAVTIIYVAGYADAASVPKTAKAIIKAFLAERYENRELTTPLTANVLPYTGQIILNQLTFHEAI